MENFTKKLGEVWYLIMAIIALSMWGATQQARISTVEAKVQEQQTTIEKIDQLLVDMAVVKNDVSYIKKEIDTK